MNNLFRIKSGDMIVCTTEFTSDRHYCDNRSPDNVVYKKRAFIVLDLPRRALNSTSAWFDFVTNKGNLAIFYRNDVTIIKSAL